MCSLTSVRTSHLANTQEHQAPGNLAVLGTLYSQAKTF